MIKVNSDFKPRSGQDETIEKLVHSLEKGNKKQTLVGATGTGKTYMIAETIARTERPALVIAPNKTLAGQLYYEMANVLPESAVEYFVSYYDYYQPESYVVSRDLFIEKETLINEEIDRMRHRATESILTRRDVVVVASVSAIYGLGNPDIYKKAAIIIKSGESWRQNDLVEKLVENQYERSDDLSRGQFKVLGERIVVWPAGQKTVIDIVFWGDEIESIKETDPSTGEIISQKKSAVVLPKSHWAISSESVKSAVLAIRKELDFQLATLLSQKKDVEAARLERRVEYDIEMLEETGFVAGIENYSAIFEKRNPGDPPFTLLDYFPRDFLCFVDESHVSIPQIAGMHKGDRSRKQTLVDHGFRLPSALDNRPLDFDEFLKRVPQLITVSATPGDWEKTYSPIVAEQLIRPTGILDPQIEVRKKEGQIENILKEISATTKKDSRVLITTISKKMAEELTDYLVNEGVRAEYIHSETDTLDRLEIIGSLKSGKIDVLVGVNLLREGLDLPEVELVIVLDADVEGFLRNETSLIQTSGRAARNVNGRVIFYANEETGSIKNAIKETNRRRRIQKEYNLANKIEPTSIKKATVPKHRFKDLGQLKKELELAIDEMRFEDADQISHEIKAIGKSKS